MALDQHQESFTGLPSDLIPATPELLDQISLDLRTYLSGREIIGFTRDGGVVVNDSQQNHMLSIKESSGGITTVNLTVWDQWLRENL